MTEIEIYDVIDEWFGVRPSDILYQLKNSSGDVTIRVNSPGGNALDGVAIYNAIHRYDKGKCIVEVDGLAASAASILAMAGDEIRMAAGSFLMVHEAWNICAGSAEDLEAQAAVLRKLNAEIAKIYAARSEQTEEACLSIMAKDTWMSAEDAVAQGFADTALAAKAKPTPETQAALRAMAHLRNKPSALIKPGTAQAQLPAKMMNPIRTPMNSLALPARIREGK